ncbi:MAG: hypothetical protein HRF46_14480 [Acidobacteriota bacterium]
MKVSWQVTGIRQDPFANAHRIPVGEDAPWPMLPPPSAASAREAAR